MSEEQGYDDELLPEQTTDDTDRGWGEAPVRRPKKSEFSARDLDLMAERPPHWS